MTGIARGRSCASILVIPRRKRSLVEDLHERAAMTGLELHGRPWGARRRGKRGGGGRRAGGGAAAGYGGGGIGGILLFMRGKLGLVVLSPCVLLLGTGRRKERKEKRERRKPKEKKEEKKEKRENFLNLKFFRKKIKDNL
jgi:hypothetical protein